MEQQAPQQDPDRDSRGNLIKPQKERVQEGISLLKQLEEAGIPRNEPGYMELKQHITAWIKEGKNGVKYFAASANVLTAVPNIKAFPTPDIEFELTSQMLQQVQRVASILKVPDISFVGDGSTIVVTVGDKTNPTGSSFDSEIGTTSKTFRVKFKVENLKMMAGDYKVAIGAKKISRFQSVSQQVTYYVAIELDSTFDF